MINTTHASMISIPFPQLSLCSIKKQIGEFDRVLFELINGMYFVILMTFLGGISGVENRV